MLTAVRSLSPRDRIGFSLPQSSAAIECEVIEFEVSRLGRTRLDAVLDLL